MSVDVFVAALKQFEQELKDKSGPVPESVVPEKPKVTGALTESQQVAHDAAERAKAEAKVVPPRPHPDQRCETVEEARQRLWKEKRRASAEWARLMGLSRTQPEWPGV